VAWSISCFEIAQVALTHTNLLNLVLAPDVFDRVCSQTCEHAILKEENSKSHKRLAEEHHLAFDEASCVGDSQ
jgi:hypothetical protein